MPSGPWNYILPCCVVPYMPSQTTEKIREMLEMIRAEMNSIIPHFKPIDKQAFVSVSNMQNKTNLCLLNLICAVPFVQPFD